MYQFTSKKVCSESLYEVELFAEGKKSNSNCSNSAKCSGTNDACTNSGNCKCSTKVN